MNERNATVVIVVLLLAIVIRAALESAFGFISKFGWSSISFLLWLQIITFFVLTLRFYLGAVRYGSLEPNKLDFHIKSVNFVFAFMLFCAFYSVGYFVVEPGQFYILVMILHIVDALWFSIAFVCSYFVNENALEVGEVKLSAYRRIMGTFWLLSVVTIAYASVSYYWYFKQPITSNAEIEPHFYFIGVLLFLSVVDFIILHKYYFRHEEWVAENAKA